MNIVSFIRFLVAMLVMLSFLQAQAAIELPDGRVIECVGCSGTIQDITPSPDPDPAPDPDPDPTPGVGCPVHPVATNFPNSDRYYVDGEEVVLATPRSVATDTQHALQGLNETDRDWPSNNQRPGRGYVVGINSHSDFDWVDFELIVSESNHHYYNNAQITVPVIFTEGPIIWEDLTDGGVPLGFYCDGCTNIEIRDPGGVRYCLNPSP